MSRAKEMIWEIETRLGQLGYEWRVAPSPSSTHKPIVWGPWAGQYTFRRSAIRAARRYCRRMCQTVYSDAWRDVERVKL